MSHESATCRECQRAISADQYRFTSCCTDCERVLHKSWAALDREYDRTRDPLQ